MSTNDALAEALRELLEKWTKEAHAFHAMGKSDASDGFRGEYLQTAAAFRLCAKELESALAQHDDWQPIDTAPKRGEVLLFQPTCKSGRMTLPPRIIIDQARCQIRETTHWMPLPPTPAARAAQSEDAETRTLLMKTTGCLGLLISKYKPNGPAYAKTYAEAKAYLHRTFDESDAARAAQGEKGDA